MIRRILPLIALLVLPGGFVAAQEKLPDGAKVAKLEARPAAIKLTGPFTYSQILVTATLDSGETVDVTRAAMFDRPAGFVSIVNGLVRPTADGAGDIVVSLAGQSLKIPFTATTRSSVGFSGFQPSGRTPIAGSKFLGTFLINAAEPPHPPCQPKGSYPDG